MKYAFMHCNLIDGKKDSPLQKDMTVLVDGDKIEAIQPGTQEISGDYYKKIDLKDRYLLPGLINMHAHLFGSGKPSKILAGSGQVLQNFVIDTTGRKLGGSILDDIVAKNVESSLNAGITTVRGVGDFHYSDVRTRDKINSGKIMGPRLIVSGPALTVTGGHGDGTFAVTADNPWDFRKLVRKNVMANVDLIKICVTSGVMDAQKRGEPALRMTVEETKAVCDEAHMNGYMVASHTESYAGVVVALEGGVDTIEHGSHLDEKTINLFKKNGSSMTCTISPAIPLVKLSPDQTKLSPMSDYNSKIVLNGIIDGAKDALANEIPVGLGTDSSCPFVTQYDMWRELYYFQKIIGVSAAFAIYTATLRNAQLMRIGNETGSIEVGKCADLIVVDKNPLEDLSALRDVTLVMARGNLIEHPTVQKNPYIEKQLDEMMKTL